MIKNGFSLIEVTIAMAIFSIVTLSIIQMFVEQIKASNYLEDQLTRAQLVRAVELLLKDNESCNNSFQDIALPAIGRTTDNDNSIQIKDNTNQKFIQTNDKYEKIQVGVITIKNESIPAANSRGRITISIPMSRQRHGGGPTILSTYSSSLIVRVKNDFLIERCENQLTNCPPSVDPSKTWLRPYIICGMVDYSNTEWKLLSLDSVRDGDAIYRDNQISDPLVIRYNKDSGSYVSVSGDGASHVEAGCLQNLQEVVETPLNRCQ